MESLLLNGEEFFGKDGSIMLENLPAYMVKDVRTYEKKEWHEVNRSYVMDVKLKRQYSVGWIANAEAGGGSDERYLGRLFALRFTPQSRLSVFGNINNINENRKPGQNGDWTPANMPEGQHTLKQVGLDYLVNEKTGATSCRAMPPLPIATATTTTIRRVPASWRAATATATRSSAPNRSVRT